MAHWVDELGDCRLQLLDGDDLIVLTLSRVQALELLAGGAPTLSFVPGEPDDPKVGRKKS